MLRDARRGWGRAPGLHQGDRGVSRVQPFARQRSLHAAPGDALQGPRARGPVVPARAALGRSVQGRHGAAGGPRIHARERPQVRPTRIPQGPRARSALNRPAEPGRRKQFATISLRPETVWKRLRARMFAWFPQIHSKERDVFENHGKKLTAALFAAGLLGAASSWAQAPAGAEGMGPMHGFERLHKELKLNAQQEDLWKRAQAAQREAFRSMRA